MPDTKVLLCRAERKSIFVTVWGHSCVVQFVRLACIKSEQHSLNSAFLCCGVKKQYAQTGLVVESASRGSGAERGRLHKDWSVQHIKTMIYNTPCCSPRMVFLVKWWESAGSERGCGCCCRSEHTVVSVHSLRPFVLYCTQRNPL